MRVGVQELRTSLQTALRSYDEHKKGARKEFYHQRAVLESDLAALMGVKSHAL